MPADTRAKKLSSPMIDFQFPEKVNALMDRLTKVKTITEKDDQIRRFFQECQVEFREEDFVKITEDHFQMLASNAFHHQTPTAINLISKLVYDPPKYHQTLSQAVGLWLLERTGHFRQYQKAIEFFYDSRKGWDVINAVFCEQKPQRFFSKITERHSFQVIDLPQVDKKKWINLYETITKKEQEPRPWEKQFPAALIEQNRKEIAAKAKEIFAPYFALLEEEFHGGWDGVEIAEPK